MSDVVSQFLAHRAAGDVEACLSLVSERATWHSPVGPPKRGPSGFREALEEAYEETRWFATETLGVRPHRDAVVAKIRNRGERKGEVLDSVQFLVFRVVEGLIVDVEIHVEDPAAVAEFWSN